MKVNPSRMLSVAEKLMLVPVDAPKVAVPVCVTLPGAVAGFQFAFALKSSVPPTGPATVGVVSQVALCAKTGDPRAKAPIKPAIAAATSDAAGLTCLLACPATCRNAPILS